MTYVCFILWPETIRYSALPDPVALSGFATHFLRDLRVVSRYKNPVP